MSNKRNADGTFVKGSFRDLTDMKFNMLTCKYMSHIRITKSGRKAYWYAICDCGNGTTKAASAITSGYAKSCGCLQREATSRARKTHGETDSRLYRIWENMKKRCYNEKTPKFKNYGARGIKVCSKWRDSYQEFSDWARKNDYNDQLTIERVDVNGDYEPSNCKWIPSLVQAKNRTSNKWVLIDGVEYSPYDLEKKYGIPVKTIYARIDRGDTGKDVIRPLGVRQFKKRPPRGN